jgi:hypothetical protein
MLRNGKRPLPVCHYAGVTLLLNFYETFTEMKYRRNVVAAQANGFLENLEDV